MLDVRSFFLMSEMGRVDFGSCLAGMSVSLVGVDALVHRLMGLSPEEYFVFRVCPFFSLFFE